MEQTSVFGQNKGGSTFGGFQFGQASSPAQQQQQQPQKPQPESEKKSVFNYGGFGNQDKKRTASLPTNVFPPKGSLSNFSMRSSMVGGGEDFKPIEQFRLSLAEVAQGKLNSRVFNQVAPGFTPNAEYLKSKRSSVFHRAFESSTAIKDFVPPVHPKSAEATAQLVKLFSSSFLTKQIDPKNHAVLAGAMFARSFTKGQTIIRYGDLGSEYFVLAKGNVRVTVY